MKKLFFVLILLAVVALVSGYVLIPGKIKIRSFAEGPVNINAAYRFLLNDKNWEKWWPGSKPYYYSPYDFRPGKKLLNRFELQLLFKKDTLKNFLDLTVISIDSTSYLWICEIESSKNPAKRWKQYFEATRIKKVLDVLTDSLKNFLGNEKNIYGLKIGRAKVTDSVLISTRNRFNHYPDAREIDIMIQKLKKYIRENNSIEKNYPMLNVQQSGPDNFEAMVAIATEKALPATKDFVPKRVLKGGNLLESEITGGPYTIRKAFEEFENYKNDLQLLSPAIPYQLLITDRTTETDTAKWITRFYYPIY